MWGSMYFFGFIWVLIIMLMLLDKYQIRKALEEKEVLEDSIQFKFLKVLFEFKENIYVKNYADIGYTNYPFSNLIHLLIRHQKYAENADEQYKDDYLKIESATFSLEQSFKEIETYMSLLKEYRDEGYSNANIKNKMTLLVVKVNKLCKDITDEIEKLELIEREERKTVFEKKLQVHID